ncbi:MAG: GFA family protein [Aestuariivirga sp.]
MSVQHYSGGCQCGAVRYEVDVDLDSALTCNCSRCQKLGSVLSFTQGEKFHLLKGEDNLTEYLFNTNRIHHLFCKTCGIESFAKGNDAKGTSFVAINANCLDGVNPRELNSKHFDGRAK